MPPPALIDTGGRIPARTRARGPEGGGRPGTAPTSKRQGSVPPALPSREALAVPPRCPGHGPGRCPTGPHGPAAGEGPSGTASGAVHPGEISPGARPARARCLCWWCGCVGGERGGDGSGGVFAQRTRAAPVITLRIPGTPRQTTPPTEACMIHSKQPRGCGIPDPATRGYRRWKTAAFSHSAGTAHGAPPLECGRRGLWRLCRSGLTVASHRRSVLRVASAYHRNQRGEGGEGGAHERGGRGRCAGRCGQAQVLVHLLARGACAPPPPPLGPARGTRERTQGAEGGGGGGACVMRTAPRPLSRSGSGASRYPCRALHATSACIRSHTPELEMLLTPGPLLTKPLTPGIEPAPLGHTLGPLTGVSRGPLTGHHAPRVKCTAWGGLQSPQPRPSGAAPQREPPPPRSKV